MARGNAVRSYFGVRLVGKDMHAIGDAITKAVEKKSWFVLGVACTLALTRLAQELGGISYVVRDQSDRPGSSPLDALEEPDGPDADDATVEAVLG